MLAEIHTAIPTGDETMSYDYEAAARRRGKAIREAAKALREQGYQARADYYLVRVVIKDYLTLGEWDRLQEQHECAISARTWCESDV